MPALKKRKDNPLSFDETECAEVRTLCSAESVSVMKLFRTGLYIVHCRTVNTFGHPPSRVL